MGGTGCDSGPLRRLLVALFSHFRDVALATARGRASGWLPLVAARPIGLAARLVAAIGCRSLRGEVPAREGNGRGCRPCNVRGNGACDSCQKNQQLALLLS